MPASLLRLQSAHKSRQFMSLSYTRQGLSTLLRTYPGGILWQSLLTHMQFLKIRPAHRRINHVVCSYLIRQRTSFNTSDRQVHKLHTEFFFCRSRWLRGLRLGPAAARLLGLRVRIPAGAWMFVSYECCALL